MPDGSIYVFGGSEVGAVSKYEPWGGWKSLPAMGLDNRGGCYLAYLMPT
eukprot:CAMPEP_0195047228 /NCGR_PEP_ID=MMETSP0347-20130606/34368_1 /TAXON_ID=2932 /ORGANISM="Alexandrium fundyense, Strain CCMP1719" /LENGTH=48 /DNA_ID= /DNA_START= /DNA_END= /DNA_ORIENTATION=